VEFNIILSININPAITTSLSKDDDGGEVRERESERDVCFALLTTTSMMRKQGVLFVSHIVLQYWLSLEGKTKERKKTKKKLCTCRQSNFDKVCESFKYLLLLQTTTITKTK